MPERGRARTSVIRPVQEQTSELTRARGLDLGIEAPGLRAALSTITWLDHARARDDVLAARRRGLARWSRPLCYARGQPPEAARVAVIAELSVVIVVVVVVVDVRLVGERGAAGRRR